jgi:hypothetical protein
MEMLGTSLEDRKKPYAGKTMKDLVQEYQKAERSRDLPTMIALLDIIKTAPKPKAGPPTTVVQDVMAAVMPQPAPPAQIAMTTPGIEGAVDAMAAQNAPQQLGMPAVMAANGGLMNSNEEPARFMYGGQGTVAPYSSLAALSMADVERMAMMGDPDALRELDNRQSRSLGNRVPGPSVGPNTSQVTDRFRARAAPISTLGVAPPPPGVGPAQIFPTQTSIPTNTGAVPTTATPSAMDAPRVFPGQKNVPGLGVPGVTPGTSPAPSAAAPSAVPTGPAAPTATASATPPAGGIRGLINRVAPYVSKGAKITGYGTAASELLRPTEANVGEDDMLAKVRMLESMGGSLSPDVREAAQAEALLPRVPLLQWKAKYFPEAAAQDLSPNLSTLYGSPRDNFNLPAFPLDLKTIKEDSEKSIQDLIGERNLYETSLSKERGIRSFEDIKKDLEKFRTEGKTRAKEDKKEAEKLSAEDKAEAKKLSAEDKAAAQKLFKDDALLTAALAAPQFLKGRGLGQAFARFSETATPGLMGAMQARKASLKETTKAERDAIRDATKTERSAIREATRSERDTADKFQIAKLDLDKAYRAEEMGKFDKAASLRADSMKTYIQASLDKYKSDVSFAATMGYVDRIFAKGLVDAATEQVKGLQLNPQFRELDPQVQQRMIQSILSNAINQKGSQRPTIIDQPGQ